MTRTVAKQRAHTDALDAYQGAAIADFVRVLGEAGLNGPKAKPALVDA
jgi:hypothetical protein